MKIVCFRILRVGWGALHSPSPALSAFHWRNTLTIHIFLSFSTVCSWRCSFVMCCWYCDSVDWIFSICFSRSLPICRSSWRSETTESAMRSSLFETFLSPWISKRLKWMQLLSHWKWGSYFRIKSYTNQTRILIWFLIYTEISWVHNTQWNVVLLCMPTCFGVFPSGIVKLMLHISHLLSVLTF